MFTILVTFLTVIADQITKYFVCINMDLGETVLGNSHDTITCFCLA